MKKVIFRGLGTALITPHRGGEVDYPALRHLIERQIAAGTEAIVIGGTTGEAATLTDGERYELFRVSRDAVAGRAALIFGTGTNDTKSAVRHTEKAERIGCDGVLVVTPYYNKGTREGVLRHYEKISECTNLPIILYNVPSRTGVDLDVEQVARLAERDNIVAIKEASGKPDRLREISELRGVSLYAGNDADTLRVAELGGCGVISVLSNLYPVAMRRLTALALSGEGTGAEAELSRLSRVMSAMFLETNPAPLKYALSRLGLITGEMRLPMCEVGEATERAVAEAMDELAEGEN